MVGLCVALLLREVSFKEQFILFYAGLQQSAGFCWSEFP